MPVGNEGVVVDVPRQSDDRDPCGPRGDDEGRPDAEEDEDESEDYSQGDQDAELGKEEGEDDGPVGDDEGDQDQTEAAEVEAAVAQVLAEVDGGEEGFGEAPGRLVEDVPRQVEAGGAHGLAHCRGFLGVLVFV